MTKEHPKSSGNVDFSSVIGGAAYLVIAVVIYLMGRQVFTLVPLFATGLGLAGLFQVVLALTKTELK